MHRRSIVRNLNLTARSISAFGRPGDSCERSAVSRSMHPGTLLGFLVIVSSMSAQLAADNTGMEFFEKRIRPVLIEHCLECHGESESPDGGLRLDLRAGWQTGGDSGPAIIPGSPESSLLLNALRYRDRLQMPPDGRLADPVIRDFEDWIRNGATDPRDGSISPRRTGTPDWEQALSHWSYQRPVQPDLPEVNDSTWPVNEVDYFILAELERADLRPAGDASREVLIRRVFHDLTGLSPEPADIDAFLADLSPDAYERIVDRLLCSREFAEHWGRHWLDIARYGESVTLRGLIFSNAWRYRDYVIEAFAADRPLDRMIREHIAGDLLPADSVQEQQRQLTATTFLALGNTNLEEQDKRQLRMDVVDEQLEAVGRAFLAQTIGCARCHDHKFDPIPTRDYYAMAGIFRNVQTLVDANVSGWIERPLPLSEKDEAAFQAIEQERESLQRQVKQLRDLLSPADANARKALSASRLPEDDTVSSTSVAAAAGTRESMEAELQRLEQQLKRFQDQHAARPAVMSVREMESIEESAVHLRGSVHNLGEPVNRGFLQAAAVEPGVRFSDAESGRRELADWIVSPGNPLTARVMANRLWHWLFGEGIVRTPDNFGTTGDHPSHPELLDFLAVQLHQSGWSSQQFLRRLVLSRTYRLSSEVSDELAIVDPENRLRGRASRRVRSAESLRDSMLQISGLLEPCRGGNTIRPGTGADYGYEHHERCRSIYAPAFRNSLPEMFALFDFADPSVVTGNRAETITPAQALWLMNHPFVQEQVRAATSRMLQEAADPDERIDWLFRRISGRMPAAAERDLCHALIAADGPPGWGMLVHSLLCSLDFRYVD